MKKKKILKLQKLPPSSAAQGNNAPNSGLSVLNCDTTSGLSLLIC